MTWPYDPSDHSDHSPPTAPPLPIDEASGLFLNHGSTGLSLDFLFPLPGYSFPICSFKPLLTSLGQ